MELTSDVNTHTLKVNNKVHIEDITIKLKLRRASNFVKGLGGSGAESNVQVPFCYVCRCFHVSVFVLVVKVWVARGRE